MGTILNVLSGQKEVLRVYHTIGRGPFNQTFVSEPDVSKSHAILFWENGNWFLRDQSKNGTIVNGKTVIQNIIKLKKGAYFQFGQSETTKWRLEENEAPSSFLASTTESGIYLYLSTNRNYPEDASPEVSFYSKDIGIWHLDDGGAEIQLCHGQKYNFCQEDWVFYENEPKDETEDNSNIVKQAQFRFLLSHNYEEVSLEILVNKLTLRLETRVHHQLLLVLARVKINDIANGVNDNLAGWVSIDEIVTMLGKELGTPDIDQYYVNVQIHRTRKQLMDHVPYGYLFSDVIERKRGVIRFRYSDCSIIPLDRSHI